MSDTNERASQQRVCTTCVFCLRKDYGYSNYTTEGTILHCLRGLNDQLDGQEEPWREVSPQLAAALDVARQCRQYRHGIPAHLDCDLELLPHRSLRKLTAVDVKEYAEDEEVATLLAAYLNGPTNGGTAK